MLVVRATDEHRREFVDWITKTSEILLGRGPIGPKEIWVFQVDFFANSSCFSVDLSADCQWITGMNKKRIFVCLRKTVIYNFSPGEGKEL